MSKIIENIKANWKYYLVAAMVITIVVLIIALKVVA